MHIVNVEMATVCGDIIISERRIGRARYHGHVLKVTQTAHAKFLNNIVYRGWNVFLEVDSGGGALVYK